MTNLDTNLPNSVAGTIFQPGSPDGVPGDQSVLLAQSDTEGTGADVNGDGIVSFDEMGPEARAAIDQILAGVNPEDLDSAVDVSADGSIIELARFDGVLTTQKDPGGNLWAFIYPNHTMEQVRANPGILLESPPVVFVSVNLPIPKLGGSKPVFSINLAAGSPEEIRNSIEAGIGPGIPLPHRNKENPPATVFFNGRVGGLSEDSGFVRGTGGMFWGAEGHDVLKAVAAFGTANGMWHVSQALENGVLEGVLPDALTNAIEAPLEALPDDQGTFVEAFTAGNFFLAGGQGVGVAYSGTVGGRRDRLNSGELASEVSLNIPVGNSVVRFAVDVSQYERAALDNPFSIDPGNRNDAAYLEGWLEHRLTLSDPLGADALPGARSFASFLYDNYTGRGLDHDEALRRIEVDLTGGPGSYEERIFQVLTEAPPEFLSRQAFADAGFGQLASFPAMATAERLLVNGATPQEAWNEVARIYADGWGDASDFGLNGGGFSGGYYALRSNLQDIGVNPLTFFVEPDLSGAEPIPTRPPLSDTVVGDLLADEITGSLADDAAEAASGRVISLERDDRIGEIVERENITLADGTDAIYVRTSTGNVFVVVDRTGWFANLFRNTEKDIQVFSLRGTSREEIEAMSVEINEGDGNDRLVSPVTPDVPTAVVPIPQVTRPEVAVAGQRDPATFGGEGLTVERDIVTLADGSTGELIRYLNADDEVVEGYLRVRVDGEDWYFDRTVAAPTPNRSILVDQGAGAPIMVALDDIQSPSGEGTLGSAFVDGTLRRQELPNGGVAIFGNTETGDRSVLYIAPGGQMRLLDVSTVAADTVFDLLQREGSDLIDDDILVPRGTEGLEFEEFDAGAILMPDDRTVIVASADGWAVHDVEETPSLGYLRDTNLTGPTLRFAQDMQALLFDGEGNALGNWTMEEAAGIAYGNYQIAALDGGGAGFTNDAYRDARFETRGPNAEPLDRDAFNAVFDAEYDALVRLVVPAQQGDTSARTTLEAAGITFLDDGRIDESQGSAVLQVAGIAGDRALDPATNAAVTALGANPTPAQVEAAMQLAEAGESTEPALRDVTALRAETKATISQLQELGGNDAAIGFLHAFDLTLGAMEAAGGDFSGTAMGQFLAGGSAGIGYFLGKIGQGDAAAWSAFTQDLGTFVTALNDGQRQAFTEKAHGLSLAGSFLILAGSGPDANDAAVISGELLTIAADGMLAAAGQIPPGFETQTTPEFAIGSGFGRLAGRYADRTATVADDIGAILLEDGLPAWQAFRTGAVFENGEMVFNGNLAGSAILAGAGGAVLNEIIDGDVGRILQAVGDGAATGITLASGAINPAQAAISGATALFDAVGVEVPPEVQMGSLVALAAVNASNPIGWAALAVQIVFQFASMRSWTEVTTLAEGIDADGDYQFDDTAELSTDFHTNFWGRVKTDDGRLQYVVPSPNGLALEHATFETWTGADRDVSFEGAHSERAGFGRGDRRYREKPDTLTIEGHNITGELHYPEGTSRNGADGGIVDRDDTVVASFVPDDDELEELVSAGILRPGVTSIPIHVTRTENIQLRNWDDDTDLRNVSDPGLEFWVDKGWREDFLTPGVRVTGRYGAINPSTDGEDFEHSTNLSQGQYDRLVAELGGTDAVTLGPNHALLNPVDDPATPNVNEGAQTAVLQVMGGVQVTFEGEKRDPNLYQYMDMNGDGFTDLVRYGIREDDDGLHSGDERYEVTLLGPDLVDLGLPTIKHANIDTAARIASLAPYLFAWAAMRPEVAKHGYDPVSLYNAATEARDIGEIVALRNIDRALAADMALVGRHLSSGDTISDAAWAEIQGNVQTNEHTATRRAQLAESLNLFDPQAYADANPGLAEAIGGPGNGMQLAVHYLRSGNRAERPIDLAGTVLPVGTPPVWPGTQSIGSELWVGDRMRKNEMLVSENGRYVARYDDDGDFTLYDVSGAEPVQLWRADNRGERTDDGWIAMQADGHLVLYDDDGDAGFRTDTNAEDETAHGAFVLRLEDDGTLVVHDRLEGDALWIGGAGQHDNGGRGITIRRARASDAPEGATPTASGRAAHNTIMYWEDGALSYLASDPALVRQYLAEGGDPVLWARNHYETVGQFGEVSINFDPMRYITAPSNGDLYLEFHDDLEGATRHFVLHGLTAHDEGRRADIMLDNGETPNRAAQFYETVMTTETGALIYLASDSDLHNAYLAQGEAAGDPVAWVRAQFTDDAWRRPNAMDFDPMRYITAPSNGDLYLAFHDDLDGATRHFVLHGLAAHNEGRRADIMLDDGDTPNGAAQFYDTVMTTEIGALTYLASDSDLHDAYLAQGEAAGDPVAWVRAQFSDGAWRRPNAMDFDVNGYLAAPNNDDLVAAFWGDPLAALRHYIVAGRTERLEGLRTDVLLDEGEVANDAAQMAGEVLGTDLGALVYIASSLDLIADAKATGATDLAAYARHHFRASGWHEDRPMTFDAQAYLEGHGDLGEAFGSDVVAAASHYITNGHAEPGRIVGDRVVAPDGTLIPAVPTDGAEANREAIMTTTTGALTYLASDTVLVQEYLASGGDPVGWARTHFHNIGQYRDVEMDFDAAEYIAAPGNDDLFMAFHDDLDGALNHFVTAGLHERLQGARPHVTLGAGETPNTASRIHEAVMTTDLGALIYIGSSPDLIADVAATGTTDLVGYARNHFVASGWRENRPMTFDPDAYLSDNPDLGEMVGDDPLAAAEHMITQRR